MHVPDYSPMIIAVVLTATTAPACARYLTSDPVGLPAGTNPYSYTDNNPNTYTDPYGLFLSTPQGAEATALSTQGAASYFRAFTRGLRYAARNAGLYGKCEQRLAQFEGEIFGTLADLYASNAVFKQGVTSAYQRAIMDNAAFASGRLGVSVASAYLTPKVGRSKTGKIAQDIGWEALLAGGALTGDLRHAIEAANKAGRGGVTAEDVANALVTGSVSDLLNKVDLDAECLCNTK